MGNVCLVGEWDMEGFAPWWEGRLPAWMLVCCRSGEAELTLGFKPYAFVKGMMAIVAPDMFPAFSARSGDFRAFYCLLDRDSAEGLLYDFPKSFFDAVHARPVVQAGETADRWPGMLEAVFREQANAYRQAILFDLLHAFVLDYYYRWEVQYGNGAVRDEMNSAELICMRFYDLVFDHFREHRDTAFYADKLCITPCYLAAVTRRICRETPKQVIDRSVTNEIKYMLRYTTLTMGQMAGRLHFPDASYMCRFFRRQTGLSLSEYRKEATVIPASSGTAVHP